MAPKRALAVAKTISKPKGKAKATAKASKGADASHTAPAGTGRVPPQPTAPAADSKALALMKKGQQSNMLTQLKNTVPDDPDYAHKMQLLKQYQNLPLRSNAKSELLKSWAKDKSCTWINTFIETNEYSETKIESGFNGWGSKCLSCNIKCLSCTINVLFYMVHCKVCYSATKEPGSLCQEPGSCEQHESVMSSLSMICHYLIP